MQVWTKEKIIELLEKNNEAIGRALLKLNKNQTFDEQQARDAKYRNNKGFRPCHARMGTEMANWFERRFWRDSVFFGAILTVSAVFLFGGLAYSAVYLLSFLDYYVDICVTAILSSMFLASKS